MWSLLLAVMLCGSPCVVSQDQRAADERYPEHWWVEPCVDVYLPAPRRDQPRPNDPIRPFPERPRFPSSCHPLPPKPCCLDATPTGKHILPVRDYLNPLDTSRQDPKLE